MHAAQHVFVVRHDDKADPVLITKLAHHPKHLAGFDQRADTRMSEGRGQAIGRIMQVCRVGSAHGKSKVAACLGKKETIAKAQIWPKREGVADMDPEDATNLIRRYGRQFVTSGSACETVVRHVSIL